MTVLRIGGPGDVQSGDDAIYMLRAAVDFHIAKQGRPLAWRLNKVSINKTVSGWYASFNESDLINC